MRRWWQCMKKTTCRITKSSIHDDLKCGWPVKARNEEITNDVEDLVLADNRIRVSVISGELRVFSKSYKHRNLSVSSVPNQNCVENSFAKRTWLFCLKMKTYFIRLSLRIRPGYITEILARSKTMQWVYKGYPPFKEEKTQVMTTVFYDVKPKTQKGLQ